MTRGHFLQIQIFDNHRTFFQQLLMNIIPRCLISDSFLLHTEQHQFFLCQVICPIACNLRIAADQKTFTVLFHDLLEHFSCHFSLKLRHLTDAK